jgi:hypothetical protein
VRCTVRGAALAGSGALRVHAAAPVRVLARDTLGAILAGPLDVRPGGASTLRWGPGVAAAADTIVPEPPTPLVSVRIPGTRRAPTTGAIRITSPVAGEELALTIAGDAASLDARGAGLSASVDTLHVRTPAELTVTPSFGRATTITAAGGRTVLLELRPGAMPRERVRVWGARVRLSREDGIGVLVVEGDSVRWEVVR